MSNQSLPPGASSPQEDRPDRGRPRDRGDGDDRRDERGAERERAPGGSSSSTMVLILHALTFLCCANWIFGVVGIVFAVRAAHKRDRGLYAQAETLTRYSWYCLGAAAVMFVVMFVLFGVVLTQAGSWVDGISPVTNY
ncbi:putative membrane protein [Spinactinospora alkalitolerans]|uniref:Putative membrane protein n=1 Tax=Spinactinospora alkalitolerans TaxID=687207 RepID=A0A852TNJ2_9ACTN|nr:hypothetical protein [Spinactinospora alkalitolerans]NYE45175.1 putative membrane protein [Spinactinospora alkalitolerans]